ncbi:hypothetical protein SynMITS9220_01332 [Synechococcus sp. MIT S9220]|uniref:hypothetical protein n=1 Tax=Synechococcus sp. WH 6501 TaxID=166310 RepID=UPI001862D28A|nr:hypothetical protein SynMITS9220_01332 [Synechococcus sp. MIT S9220]
MKELQPYRVEELNPFQEWHLHGSTIEMEEALKWAKSLSKQINRSVRVLDPAGNIIEMLR